MTSAHDHPAFRPPPPGTTVWRYMDHEPKFVGLLEEERLWMQRLPAQQDKLEGTEPAADAAWWEAQIAAATSADQQAILRDNRDFLARARSALRENWYASCWTMNDHEDRRMWAGYTKSSRSVAVRSTYELLRRGLPSFVWMGAVTYIDYTSERIEDLNLMHRAMHKHGPEFAWEREMRALVDLSGPDHLPWVKQARECCFEKPGDPEFRVVLPEIDVVDIVEQVVCHPDATDDYVGEVERLCAKAGLPPPSRSSLAYTHPP